MQYDNFISFLKNEKRYSPHTLISYQNDLGQFSLYLENQYTLNSPSEITHFHIRSWMVELMNHGIKSRSINRKLSTIKSWFRFLIKNGTVNINPTVKIQSPKTSKKLPSFVDDTGTDKMFNEIEFKEGFAGLRDKLILDILYSTGLRLSELINLKESDIQYSRGEVKVLGKGNKQRIIPLDRTLLERINQYKEEKCKHFQNEYLIITDSGNKMYPKFAYRIVNRYLSLVTTVDKKSPHTLRHTFATHLVNNGAELNAVKELLGHSSLAATQVYTHNNIEKLKDTYKKAHPKA